MAEERDTSVDTSSLLMAKLAVTESSEVPFENEATSRGTLSTNTKSDDGDKEEERQETQLEHILDDISEEDDDEDDTNLVVLDPNHVKI